MEVILDHLLKRAKYLYQHPTDYQPTFTPYMLMPFFNNRFTLDDYLSLDDGVLSTYFIHWTKSEDDILADLARRFLNRRPFKSALYDNQTGAMLEKLTDLITTAGFNAEYYTATNSSYKLPYDTYHPQSSKPQSQIELIQPNGELVELTEVSTLVAAIAGRQAGDERFFFPKEMLAEHDLAETADAMYVLNQDISSYAVYESSLVSLPITYKSIDQLNTIKNNLVISKLMITDEPAAIDDFSAKLTAPIKRAFNIVRSEPYYLEFVNPSASKGAALASLGQELGVTRTEMMAIGNAQNDESMITYAGIGVAMSNSIPSTIQLADELVADNNHDGVAEAVEKFALA